MNQHQVKFSSPVSHAWATVAGLVGFKSPSKRRSSRVSTDSNPTPAEAYRRFAYDKLQQALEVNVEEAWGPMIMFQKASYAASLAPSYACARSVQALAFMYRGNFDLADEYNRWAFNLEPSCELAKEVQEEINLRRKIASP